MDSSIPSTPPDTGATGPSRPGHEGRGRSGRGGPRLDGSEDVALVRRALDGEAGAAETLFDRHFEPLYGFVHYRVGRDAGLAEDVVQETLLVAFRQLREFEARSSFHTWLCGIALNKVRSARRKRRPRLLEDVLDERQSEIDALLATIDSEALPDAALERQETRDLVGATLSSLPPHYRRALLAKYVEGGSTSVVALEQGTTVKAAESLLTRSRLAFARVFQLLAKGRGGLA